jgi:glutamate carboxypeptidase
MVRTVKAGNILDDCMKEKAGFVKLLRRMVQLETPPAGRKSHQKFFALLEKELRSLDYDTTVYPGQKSGGQILARPQNKLTGGYQLLLGHADTVWPEGTLQKMPFSKEDNVLSGPGIYDMKAGISMMVTALKILQKHELQPAIQPVIFINSDEETGSTDSVANIMRLAKMMKRVYVLEPSLDPDGKLKTRRKGVGHYEIIIKGVSSHAGIEPEKGKSAILELSYLIQKLHALNDPEQGISVNVGKIDGGISTNVVAGESSASVDVRVLTKKDAERIDKEIQSITSTTPGVTLEITGGFKRPPLVQNDRNRMLWNAAQSIADELGFELNQGISGGGSDGSYTSIHTATLDGLGAVGDGAHSPTEKIFLEETLERVALLTLLILIPDLNGKSTTEFPDISELVENSFPVKQ